MEGAIRLLIAAALLLGSASLWACSGAPGAGAPGAGAEEEEMEEARAREPLPPIPEEREWPAALRPRCRCRVSSGGSGGGAVLTIAQGKAALRAALALPFVCGHGVTAEEARRSLEGCMEREGSGAVETCALPAAEATSRAGEGTTEGVCALRLRAARAGEGEAERLFVALRSGPLEPVGAREATRARLVELREEEGLLLPGALPEALPEALSEERRAELAPSILRALGEEEPEEEPAEEPVEGGSR